MALYVERKGGESWRDCVKRIAAEHGLEAEVMETYRRDRNRSRAQAAFDALYTWDCCSYTND